MDTNEGSRIILPGHKLDGNGRALPTKVRCIFEPSQLICLLLDAGSLARLSSARLSPVLCPICKAMSLCAWISLLAPQLWIYKQLAVLQSSPPSKKKPCPFCCLGFPRHASLSDNDRDVGKSLKCIRRHGHTREVDKHKKSLRRASDCSLVNHFPPEHHCRRFRLLNVRSAYWPCF